MSDKSHIKYTEEYAVHQRSDKGHIKYTEDYAVLQRSDTGSDSVFCITIRPTRHFDFSNRHSRLDDWQRHISTQKHSIENSTVLTSTQHGTLFLLRRKKVLMNHQLKVKQMLEQCFNFWQSLLQQTISQRLWNLHFQTQKLLMCLC